MLITIISQISITFDHLFHSKVEFALMRGQRLWVKKISLNKSQDMRSSSQKKEVLTMKRKPAMMETNKHTILLKKKIIKDLIYI